MILIHIMNPMYGIRKEANMVLKRPFHSKYENQ